MTVGRICVREVDLIDADESVQVAARRMNDRNVGTLVVLNEAKEPVGIVTDRDLTIRVLSQGRNPIETLVSEVMTHNPDCVREDAPLEDAISVMRAGPFRRIPVVDRNGRLAGLLSVDDVLDLLREEFNQIGDIIERESPRSLAQK